MCFVDWDASSTTTPPSHENSAVPDYRHDLQFGVFITPVAGQARRRASSWRGWPTSSAWTSSASRTTRTSRRSWTRGRCCRSSRRRRPTSASRRTSPTSRCGRRSCWRAAPRAWTSSAAGGSSSGSAPGRSGTRSPPLGGPRLTPGQSVDALAEAIEIIRAIWSADGRAGPATTARHYRSTARSPARRPRTTSRSGWAPTSRGCCASPARRPTAGSRAWPTSSSRQLPDMNAAIDEAATDAGRRPEADPAADQRQRQLRRAGAGSSRARRSSGRSSSRS